MADNLDDEWWTDQNNAYGADGDTVENQKEQKPSKVKGTKDKSEKKKKKNKPEKRKVEEESTKVTTAEDPPKAKKRKRKLKSEEIAAKPVVGLTPGTLVSALNRHYSDKLSTLEWDEVKMDTEKHFCECNDLTHNPVSYLKTIFPKWGTAIKKSGKTGDKSEELKPGSPLMIIITQAALRATQLNRDVADFKGTDCKIAKLFAKHFKLHEQTKFLSKGTVHLGIGTPSRIQALIENGALKLDSVRRIVLDWSWRDVKYRRMVEISEIRDPLFDLLRKHIIPKLKDSTCKIGLM